MTWSMYQSEPEFPVKEHHLQQPPKVETAIITACRVPIVQLSKLFENTFPPSLGTEILTMDTYENTTNHLSLSP